MPDSQGRADFKVADCRLEMSERLLQAAMRVDSGPVDGVERGLRLRPEQTHVFNEFAAYLMEVATRPVGAQSASFCRIIQPPRTGKTVVAGHIIDRTGLTATFVVPTKTLVTQTVRALSRIVPNAAIGVYCGEQQSVVAHGVNVVTYAMLQRHAANLPAPLRDSALVFVDEAHHAMTESRIQVLRDVFDILAIRIALTATPDYSWERRLSRYFPDLIHEIGLDESLELGLLAPVRVWIAEVDADASSVRFVAGDYDQETLGRLMSSGPFFRAVQVFRYCEQNVRMPALITCASRRQAVDLLRYLETHRPCERPSPGLILGDTGTEERDQLLASFEAGTVDTLIQVGVLIEGWNSPHCKLLLDLAPSASRVRATQKYFRVMTRYGDAEARIYVLLPTGLQGLPILPMELFSELSVYECGALVTGGGAQTPRLLASGGATPIAGVRLENRILVSARLARPTLDRTRPAEIRAVVETCPDFDHDEPCGLFRFRGLLFQHPSFVGSGSHLLRWLQVEPTRRGYGTLLARLYPDASGVWLLAQAGVLSFRDRSCCEDRAHFELALLEPSVSDSQREIFASTRRALSGVGPEPSPTPEQLLLEREETVALYELVARLQRRRRRLLARHMGLFGHPPATRASLAAEEGISIGRVGQLIATSMRKIRRWIEQSDVRESLWETRMRGATARRKAREDASACWQALVRDKDEHSATAERPAGSHSGF